MRLFCRANNHCGVLFLAEYSLVLCKAANWDCAHLINCLNLYSVGLKTKHQLQKVNARVVPHTSPKRAAYISPIPGVPLIENLDIDLGLPTFSLKLERVQFSFRVLKRFETIRLPTLIVDEIETLRNFIGSNYHKIFASPKVKVAWLPLSSPWT